MSTSLNKYKEYASKAIFSKVNPEFIGIARSYSSVKKQRIMSQQLLDERSHEFSTIEKINKSLEKSITNKKRQLKYVQAVRYRYIEDLTKKQKLHEHKNNELDKIRKKSNDQRVRSMVRLAKSKQDFSEKKKKQADQTKGQLKYLKHRKIAQESKLWQTNNSRVKEIESDKKRINEYCNRFFQNKNKKFVQNYKEMINRDRKVQEENHKVVKTLEEKLVMVRQKTSQRQRQLNKLEQQIQLSRSLTSSRAQSTRSMTPMEILRPQKQSKSSAQISSSQRPKLRLLMS